MHTLTPVSFFAFASPGLWMSSLLDSYQILDAARSYNRVDMLRFMLSLEGIDELILVKGFQAQS